MFLASILFSTGGFLFFWLYQLVLLIDIAKLDNLFSVNSEVRIMRAEGLDELVKSRLKMTMAVFFIGSVYSVIMGMVMGSWFVGAVILGIFLLTTLFYAIMLNQVYLEGIGALYRQNFYQTISYQLKPEGLKRYQRLAMVKYAIYVLLAVINLTIPALAIFVSSSNWLFGGEVLLICLLFSLLIKVVIPRKQQVIWDNQPTKVPTEKIDAQLKEIKGAFRKTFVLKGYKGAKIKDVIHEQQAAGQDKPKKADKSK